MEPDVLSGYRPTGTRIAVKPNDPEEVRESGLVIPAQAQERPSDGVVVGVSEHLSARGEFQVGDEVVYSKYGGTQFEHDGESLVILSDTDVLLVRSP